MRARAAAPSHALLSQRSQQVFCKPLVGESIIDRSHTWKDGVELRSGVSYVLANGCQLAFGGRGVMDGGGAGNDAG